MEGRKPWLLIDVDGVLNPLRVQPGFDIHRLAPIGWTGRPLHVQLTPRHGEMIMAMTDVFDLAWATTWEDSANALISPIVGLPADLPVVHFAWNAAAEVWGICLKTPDVAQWVGDQPFVWLDDGVGPEDVAWFARRPETGAFHLQHINPLVGLTQRDLDDARAWAATLD